MSFKKVLKNCFTSKYGCNVEHTMVPWYSIIMSIAACVVFLMTPAINLLQFERERIITGEIWRIVTCHFTHWSFEHLVWDVIMFLVLGAICEVISRRAFIFSVVSCVLIIPSFLWYFMPEMSTYRGLSGLDASLFFCAAAWVFIENLKKKQWVPLGCICILVCLFIGKMSYEYLMDSAFFVASENFFIPVPSAHIIGAIIGIISSSVVCLKKNASIDLSQRKLSLFG